MNAFRPLEPRLLFATGDPIFQMTNKGTLIVHGTDTNDEIVVQLKHGTTRDGVQVFVTPDKPNSNIEHSFSLAYNKIKRIRIEAGDGDDNLFVSGYSRPVTILGGAGNDQITYPPTSLALIDGGDGNDRIGSAASINVSSNKNHDALNAAFAEPNTTPSATILGGDGDDTLVGDSNDSVDGGAGNDTSTLVVSGKDISDDRRAALAADYFARIGETNVENFKGFDGGSLSAASLISGQSIFVTGKLHRV